MLDHVMVTAYGQQHALTGLAQVVLKNPNLIVVNPFDAAVRNPGRAPAPSAVTHPRTHTRTHTSTCRWRRQLRTPSGQRA